MRIASTSQIIEYPSRNVRKSLVTLAGVVVITSGGTTQFAVLSIHFLHLELELVEELEVVVAVSDEVLLWQLLVLLVVVEILALEISLFVRLKSS
jgi:hypothetical protein